MASLKHSGMNPLPSLLRASAHDAGDQSMRAAGRTTWNDDDWNAMCETHNRLVAACYGVGPLGCVRFGFAEALQQAGVLTLATKDFFGVLNREFDAYEASLAGA